MLSQQKPSCPSFSPSIISTACPPSQRCCRRKKEPSFPPPAPLFSSPTPWHQRRKKRPPSSSLRPATTATAATSTFRPDEDCGGRAPSPPFPQPSLRISGRAPLARLGRRRTQDHNTNFLRRPRRGGKKRGAEKSVSHPNIVVWWCF